MAYPQGDGVYRKDNGQWVNFNDNNQIYQKNSGTWQGGANFASTGLIYRKENGGWVQIYPRGVVQKEGPTLSAANGNIGTKQKKYTSWKTSTIRQGWCTKDSAGGEQFGVANLQYSSITGGGNVISVGTCYFGGKTGASGNYNAAQRVTIHGCNWTGSIGSGDPFGTNDYASFTYNWKGTGANTTVPEGALTEYSNGILRWINNTGSYGRYLCLYNGETSSDTGSSYEKSYSNNYLAFTQFKFRVGSYSYEASAAMLSADDSMPTTFAMFNSDVPKKDNYLNLVLPANYDISGMSTSELVEKIENEEIEYVTPDKMITFGELEDYKPVIYQIENNKVYISPIFDGNIWIFYEYNGEWIKSLQSEPRTYVIREGSTNVRLMNELTGEIYCEYPVN